MRQIFICASAFSVAMFGASIGLLDSPLEPIEKTRYQMIECESMEGQRYDVVIDESRFKALSKCKFTGFYLSGLPTKL